MLVLDEVINKYFSNGNIRHAYLLETKDYNKVLIIAKKILKDYNCHEKNIDYLIDNGLYPDLKIIDPDGQWIKKEQILNLQSDFKIKSVYDNKRVYIIKNAENLNKSAANTMLKFLEEPEENIIALLVTGSKNKVLETIVSRCQYIMLDTNKEVDESYEPISMEIFNLLEIQKQGSTLEIMKKLDDIGDKNNIRSILNGVILIYEQLLLKKIGIEIHKIRDEHAFDKTLKNTKIEDIQQRIKALIFVESALEYNVNLKLLMDKLVILMFGVD